MAREGGPGRAVRRREFLTRTLPAAGLGAPLALAALGCDGGGRRGGGGGGGGGAGGSGPLVDLAEARSGFKTTILKRDPPGDPLADCAPPFQKTTYPAPLGANDAYVVSPPDPSTKGPIVLWVTGGDSASIDQSLCQPGPPQNDQTVASFRRAGLGMMFPSLRGGNRNPGIRESFYGELDDLLAAGKFAMKLPWVDPKRIYLGGHSTGGTLVLLMAAYADGFRAVFPFGPVAQVRDYGGDFTYCVPSEQELRLRSPGNWLHSIKTPTFVFEGTEGNANAVDLDQMKRSNKNPLVHFYAVRGADHFSVLSPVTELIARKIHADVDAACNIDFPDDVRSVLRGG